jgi:peroxiredoxin
VGFDFDFESVSKVFAMSHGRPGHAAPVQVSLEPAEGWHCTHSYYRFDRGTLQALSVAQRRTGAEQVIAALDPQGPEATSRLQTSLVSGHKADFGVMLMDAHPLKVEAINQRLLGSELGPAIVPTYSFVSVTEVSEYVPSVEQYAKRLVEEGETEGTPAFNAKVKAYTDREPFMRRQRLTPDLPPWPATCFYPMNKKRKVGENWFTLPFAERNRLMAEHARSGMAFAGKVSQLITVGVGLDDWEWGVTLWGANPAFLKDIVYKMRFDEASARYAEFGAFYVSYIMSADEMLRRCHVL